MADSSFPADPLAEAAALIRDVGLSAERARRYRALASSLAEPTLDRSLELGSAVRRAGRAAADAGAVIATAIVELRQLLAQANTAIADVRASAPYREAAAAFAANEVASVAARAVEIFTDVELGACPPVVAWELPIGGERGGDHFASPSACAERIETIRREGLPAGGGAAVVLGGDETITPVSFTTDLETVESPVALVYETRALPGPLCRITRSALAVCYAKRVHAPFAVRCAGTVTDEWWLVRPDAYHEWRTSLQELLRAQGFVVTSDP